MGIWVMLAMCLCPIVVMNILLEPSIEKNYETGEYLLFFNDYFRNDGRRGFISTGFFFKKEEE